MVASMKRSFDNCRSRRLDPWAPLLVLLSLYLASCSGNSGPERVAVQGTIRLGEVPLANGQIRYIPMGETSGPAAVAAITDGQYAFNEADGPIVGTHRIEIESLDRFDFELDDEQAFARSAESGKLRKRPLNPIPAIYNVKSKLTATVERDGDPIFDFDLDPGPSSSVTRR
jgi:hypothetical protein